MKILITYPSLERSARSFDTGSLVEQIKETYNALLILARFPEMEEGWMAEWENYQPALADYCLELCKEAINRGLLCPEHGRLLKLIQTTSGLSWKDSQQPPALIDPDYHLASRAILLKKVAFEYVRANAAVKVHDKLNLTREQAEKILETAKENYYWYDQFNWRPTQAG